MERATYRWTATRYLFSAFKLPAPTPEIRRFRRNVIQMRRKQKDLQRPQHRRSPTATTLPAHTKQSTPRVVDHALASRAHVHQRILVTSTTRALLPPLWTLGAQQVVQPSPLLHRHASRLVLAFHRVQSCRPGLGEHLCRHLPTALATPSPNLHERGHFSHLHYPSRLGRRADRKFGSPPEQHKTPNSPDQHQHRSPPKLEELDTGKRRWLGGGGIERADHALYSWKMPPEHSRTPPHPLLLLLSFIAPTRTPASVGAGWSDIITSTHPPGQTARRGLLLSSACIDSRGRLDTSPPPVARSCRVLSRPCPILSYPALVMSIEMWPGRSCVMVWWCYRGGRSREKREGGVEITGGGWRSNRLRPRSGVGGAQGRRATGRRSQA